MRDGPFFEHFLHPIYKSAVLFTGTALQTVDKLQSTVNFLKNPKKPKGKGIPHVEYKHINTTRKKIRR